MEKVKTDNSKLLGKNLPFILANREKILANPRYFHCLIDYATIATSHGATEAENPSLGVLLILWSENLMKDTCPDCNAETVCLYHDAVFTLSGTNFRKGYCSKCGKLLEKKQRQINFYPNMYRARALMRANYNEFENEEEVDGVKFDWAEGTVPCKKVVKAKYKKVEPADLETILRELARS